MTPDAFHYREVTPRGSDAAPIGLVQTSAIWHFSHGLAEFLRSCATRSFKKRSWFAFVCESREDARAPPRTLSRAARAAISQGYWMHYLTRRRIASRRSERASAWSLQRSSAQRAQRCRFSASGSAEANTKTGADATGSSSFQAQTETPPPPPPPEQQPREIKLVGSRLDYRGVINFEYDKASLQNDEATKKTLAEFKKYLEAQPGVAIEVQGHTDSRASDEYNRDLSNRRAATVRTWLVENGIAADRITSVGKGEDAPQVPEPDSATTRAGRHQTLRESWAPNGACCSK